jgi:hypothetical protein
MAEGQRLRWIGRTSNDPVKLRRAIVVLMSAQGQSVPDIAHLLDCSPECVRGVMADPAAEAPAGPARISPHKHRDVASWAAGNDVELVFPPTYG